MRRLAVRGHERGQVLPLVAACLVALLGFAALAVDVGAAQQRQRAQQTATDAAAIAGAMELEYSSSSSGVAGAAQADATTDGFTSDSNDTVAVNYPPASGNLAGNASAVQVIISSKRPTFFAGALNQASDTVVTTATAMLTSNGVAPCIYQLDPKGSFTENSGTINAPACGIVANGSSSYNSGSITASSIGYAGSLSVNTTTFVDASPAPSIPAADPCAQITGCAQLADNPPSTSPCNHTNFVVPGSTQLSPGVYCGGITIDGSMTVTFNPGLYVLTGNFIVNGNSTITGAGVTFVMDSGGLTLNGNSATATLSAPNTGPYSNVLFYQPKSNTTGPTLNSGSNGSLIGALYFPGALITGNSSGDQWTLIIGASITLNSASLQGPNGKGMTGGVQNVVLAE